MTENIQVDNARRLFVDDVVIAVKKNVERTLHNPVKHSDDPIFFPCRPWEGNVVSA